MKPIAVRNIISDLCRSWGIEKKLKEQTAITMWPGVVGEKIAKESHPLYVKGGKFFLYVEKAVWRNELNFMKSDIIRKLNQSVGTDVIKDIVFCTKKGASHPQ